MYFKIFILLGIFNYDLMLQYWYLFAIMIVVSAIVAYFFYRQKPKVEGDGAETKIEEEEKNPLEFKVAILFAILFIAFTLITNYALVYFGDSGLRILSIIVGVTDINPFIINLFQAQHNNVSDSLLILAAFQAIISNNVVKMFYGMFFSGNKLMKDLCTGFGIICVCNILLLIIEGKREGEWKK